jgi:hypothetical protein
VGCKGSRLATTCFASVVLDPVGSYVQQSVRILRHSLARFLTHSFGHLPPLIKWIIYSLALSYRQCGVLNAHSEEMPLLCRELCESIALETMSWGRFSPWVVGCFCLSSYQQQLLHLWKQCSSVSDSRYVAAHSQNAWTFIFAPAECIRNAIIAQKGTWGFISIAVGVQIPGARLPGRQFVFLRWSLIGFSTQHRICCVSTFWRLEFWSCY